MISHYDFIFYARHLKGMMTKSLSSTPVQSFERNKFERIRPGNNSDLSCPCYLQFRVMVFHGHSLLLLLVSCFCCRNSSFTQFPNGKSLNELIGGVVAVVEVTTTGWSAPPH
jgi:hypothetical protein